MVVLPMYHIFLICTAIGSLVLGGILHQGADEAYVILLPEAITERAFVLLMDILRHLDPQEWEHQGLAMCATSAVIGGAHMTT